MGGGGGGARGLGRTAGARWDGGRPARGARVELRGALRGGFLSRAAEAPLGKERPVAAAAERGKARGAQGRTGGTPRIALGSSDAPALETFRDPHWEPRGLEDFLRNFWNNWPYSSAPGGLGLTRGRGWDEVFLGSLSPLGRPRMQGP